MDLLIGVFIGLFVGTFLAVIIVALCIAAGERDDLDEMYYKDSTELTPYEEHELERRCE